MKGAFKMNAEDILREIEQMDNGERIKLLEALFDKHFDNRPPKEVLEREKSRDMWEEKQ
jgi:hypothetical protein